MAQTVERGDLYFFYRPAMDCGTPSGLEDIQRFYLVMLPDERKKGRMMIVGRKCLPAISSDRDDSEERHWVLTSAVDVPEKLARILHPFHYETKTRGEREGAEAIPAGEARYALLNDGASSFLLYRLTTPDNPGEAQETFGIHKEAGYVIAVRNPRVNVPGFPQSSPDYPQKLHKKFAEERWIAVDDAALLDYENAQLVLIGAMDEVERSDNVLSGEADLFGNLGLDRPRWPTAALEGAGLAGPGFRPQSEPAQGDPSRGGRRGGRQALNAPSAAGVARALKGIRFPASRHDLVEHAGGDGANPDIMDTLRQLKPERYDSMADVEKALGEIR